MVADSARTFTDLTNVNIAELRVSGTSTFTGAQAFTGAATFASTVGITGALTLTVPLTKANINANATRKSQTVNFNGGAALADATTYRLRIGLGGRAATVTKVTTNCSTAIASGTNTLKVLSGGAAGTTLLSTATVDPVTVFVVNTVTALTLAGTPTVVATNDILIELVTGTQGTAGVGLSVTVEYQLDDA